MTATNVDGAWRRLANAEPTFQDNNRCARGELNRKIPPLKLDNLALLSANPGFRFLPFRTIAPGGALHGVAPARF